MALAIATSASAVVAVQRQAEARRQEQVARRQERDATSRLLAAAARNELEGRLDRALLLGAEALRLAQTGQRRDVLVSALQHDPRRRTHVWPNGRVDDIALSADGRLLATAGIDDDQLGGPYPVTVTDLRSRRTVATLSRPARARSMAFSPDGRLFALAEESVTIWDASSWRQIGAPLPVSVTGSISFSGDSRMLAAGASVWDVATRRQLGAVPRSG